MSDFALTGLAKEMLLFGLGFPDLPISQSYKAIIGPKEQKSVIGSIIKLDARSSTGDLGGPPKYFYWTFKSIPIGSQVNKFGFQNVEEDGSVVKFSPDIVGFYTVSLVIGDDNYNSEEFTSEIYISVIMIPHSQGLIPDASFIWNYLGDFWNLYNEKGKFSTNWSSYLQIVASDLLSLWQTDYNKSINTIQDLFQKRWDSVDPKLELDPEQISFILADDTAGSNASSLVFNSPTQPVFSSQISIEQTDGNFVMTPYGKKIANRMLSFDKQSYFMSRSSNLTNVTPKSIFFTNDKVIGNQSNNPWRFSTTIKHLTLNFENEGVSIGDTVIVEVSNGLKKTKVNVQVSAVSGNNIGIVFSLDDLIPGTAVLKFNDETILRVMTDLNIPISKDINGNLVYQNIALFIKNTITSIAFKRQYYEEELNYKSLINVGPFSVTINPLAILRNHKVKVDDNDLLMPSLQEYVDQPILSRIDGNSYISRNDTLSLINREPIFMFQNLDFIISNENSLVDLSAILIANSSKVRLPFGDLVDRSIEQGDYLVIEAGNNKGTYSITKVVSHDTLNIYPSVKITENVKVKLVRRIKGNFIRFVKESFSAAIPTPSPLWSETTFLDNGQAIENNFGLLVGVTREDIETLKVSSPYKSVVAGLLHSISKGPTLENLRIGAQILLGLPFTYRRGIIKEINPDYKLNDDFSPKQGRIVIAELDQFDEPTGLTDIYFYPRGKQLRIMGKWIDQDPDFSGLDINKTTGKEFAVGDIVEQFVALSKGVRIDDYLTGDTWANNLINSNVELSLKKYHLGLLRANTDIFNGPDISFVSQYIKKTKPSYIDLKSISYKNFVDYVSIVDKLKMTYGFHFLDVTGLSFPSANAFQSGIETQNFVNFDGTFYSRYIKGNDLTTTFGSNTVISQGGGFINPRVNENHDSPFIYKNFLLIIYKGPNAGQYYVDSVSSDTTIDLQSVNFQSLSGQSFAIYRPISNPISSGSVTVTLASPLITLPSGLFSAGVTTGDKLFFYSTNWVSRIYTLQDATTLDKAVTEPSGSYSYIIFREGWLRKFLLSDSSSKPFLGTTINGNPWIQITNSLSKLIVKKGDMLYLDDHPPYSVLDWDPMNLLAFVTPTPNITDIQDAKIWRDSLEEGFPLDLESKILEDEIQMETTPKVMYSCITTSGSRIITLASGISALTYNILPGDFFRIQSGPDSSVDCGYGNGIYPIAEIVDAQNIKITRNLTFTGPQVKYSFIRIT